MCGSMVSICDAGSRRRQTQFLRKTKPRKREYLLAVRALIEAGTWKRVKELETQFAKVFVLTPPDRIALDFPDEDLRIEMRVHCPLQLARILSVGPLTNLREK